jgi:hypothetical protein
MNQFRYSKVACLLILLVAAFGCKSKQEQQSAQAPAAQQAQQPQQAAPGAASQPAGPKPVASSKDQADARAAGVKVLDQLNAGQFAAVYQAASPAFKQIGPEEAFVAKFKETRLKTGSFGAPKEVKFDTRPDNIHVLVYNLQNDRFNTEMRLSFQRSKDGKMELVGMNQHDEPKGKAK